MKGWVGRMGYLNGISDGRGMDTSPDVLSPVDLQYVQHMRSVRYIDGTDHDVVYLKHMISKFRFNQLLLLYLAIYTAQTRGNLPDSLLEFDHEIMYVAVSTRSRLISCIVGYDIDHYTLRWYMNKKEGTDLLSVRSVSNSDLHVMVRHLIAHYSDFNKRSR